MGAKNPFTLFLKHLEAEGRSANTINCYRLDLAGFADWFLHSNGSDVSLASITPTDMRLYKQHLVVSKKQKPATVNRKLASLRSLASWALNAGKISVPFTKGVKDVAQQLLAPRWLERQEENKLVREAERDMAAARSEPAKRQAQRDSAMLILSLNTGLRIGELCALDRTDIKLSERKGTLTVRRGKGGKNREVPLNAHAREALRTWLKVRPDTKTEKIFTGKRSEGLTPSAVQRRLAEYGRRAGVEVSPHTLRHTFAKR